MSKFTRQQAIDAHCKSCSYDPLDKGTWRYQVENCCCPECQLYDYRPVTISKKKQRKSAGCTGSTYEAVGTDGEEQPPSLIQAYSVRNHPKRDDSGIAQDGCDEFPE